MKRIQFVDQEFYHIYNRGVEKRDIFCEQKDYVRFIHDLYEFNDSKPAIKGHHYDRIKEEARDLRERLVDVVCFVLMPNHFHLILRQKQEDGITDFIRKVCTGYTMVFNQNNKRVGPLFQGRFKAVHVANDVYLTHLTRYIHLNPLDLSTINWQEKNGDFNKQKADKFLRDYRWSSYPDYVGLSNFPSVLNGQDFVLEYFSHNRKDYKEFVLEWTEEKMLKIQDLTFEKGLEKNQK